MASVQAGGGAARPGGKSGATATNKDKDKGRGGDQSKYGTDNGYRESEAVIGGHAVTVSVGADGKAKTTPTGEKSTANRYHYDNPSGYNNPNKLAPNALPMGGPIPPGATPDVPNASWGQVIGNMTQALPGGMLNNAEDAVDAIAKGKAPGVGTGGTVGRAIDAATGQTPGRQEGYRADRYRGEDSMGGIGGSGGAVSDDAGQDFPQAAMLSPASRAIVGDSSETPGSDAISGAFSDVTLQDVPEQLRRRRSGTSSMMTA